MQNRELKAVKDFDVLFALRTGLTIMMPKSIVFEDKDNSFKVEGDALVVTSKSGTLTLKGLKKQHIDDAISRGFVMFYETEDDEVTRNTLCRSKP